MWRQDSGEKAWWLDANENIEERKSLPTSPSPKKDSSRCSSSRSNSRSGFLKHQQSGERAWWLSDDPENIPSGVEIIVVSETPKNDKLSNLICSENYASRRIRHIDSGEKAWWMDNTSQVPEGIVNIQGDSSNSNSDSSESLERVDLGIGNKTLLPGKFPVVLAEEPLGDRASPEGVSVSNL